MAPANASRLPAGADGSAIRRESSHTIRPAVIRAVRSSRGPILRSTFGPHHACAMAWRCYDAKMPKVRTTVTLDEQVLKWVKVRAARMGKGDSEVIEDSLRRDLGLELLERLWSKNQMPEDQAAQLAVEAQHSTRPRRRR